jgi:hypothetical protein
MSRTSYDTAPQLQSADPQLRKVADVVRGAMQGKLNCVLDVTLRASQTTTVVTDSRIGPFSFIAWMPLTANASTAEKAGIWASPTLAGTVTLNHASAVAVDQTLRLLVIG